MLTEKIFLVAVMLCIALVVASVIKFEQVTFKTIALSVFMPVILVLFLIDFTAFILKNDLVKFSVKEKIPRVLKLLAFDIQCLPMIHTAIVETFQNTVQEKRENHFVKLIFTMSANKLPMQKLRQELNPILGK